MYKPIKKGFHAFCPPFEIQKGAFPIVESTLCYNPLFYHIGIENACQCIIHIEKIYCFLPGAVQQIGFTARPFCCVLPASVQRMPPFAFPGRGALFL